MNLEDLRINPSLVIILEASDALISQRLQTRKVDPLTGNVYNPLNPTNDQAVEKRLQSHTRDTAELID
jgi:hypothetical protein